MGADPSNPPITVAGPEVAEIFVVVAGHEAALLEAEADQLVAAPAPALATLPPAVSITSNIFVYIFCICLLLL